MKKIDKKYFDNSKKYIPLGIYCYKTINIILNDEVGSPTIHVDVCPFLDHDHTKREQENGYCHFLKKGDWEENGTSFLWDQVKECGINYEDEEMMEMNREIG